MQVIWDIRLINMDPKMQTWVNLITWQVINPKRKKDRLEVIQTQSRQKLSETSVILWLWTNLCTISPFRLIVSHRIGLHKITIILGNSTKALTNPHKIRVITPVHTTNTAPHILPALAMLWTLRVLGLTTSEDSWQIMNCYQEMNCSQKLN